MDADAPGPVPVTVVTGFLGAGKTTLLNRWLADFARGDVAVVVNEHGEVGIDGATLAARVRELVEITGGCVCCSTRAELVGALEQLASTPSPPKRILVETSGAASPSGVLRAIAGGGRQHAYVVDGVITVVDATRANLLVEHDVALEQLGYADIVALSRADLCDAEGLARAKDVVATHNEAAFVVTAGRGEVEDPSLATLEMLLDQRRADFVPARDVLAAPQSEHVYQSVSLVLDGDVDEERFADFMEVDVAQFAGRLFRTKGILAVAGIPQRMIVQGVADCVEVTFGEPFGEARRTSRFVLVGYGLDRAALARAFATCAAADEPAS